MTIDEQLKQVRDWARERLKGGGEPPHAWYRYMQLREACDEILKSRAVTKVDSRTSLEPKRQFRLVGEERKKEKTPPRSDSIPVTLPM